MSDVADRLRALASALPGAEGIVKQSLREAADELDVTEAALLMATEAAGMWSRKYAAVEESRDLWRRTAQGLQVSYEACCKRANKAEKERDAFKAEAESSRESYAAMRWELLWLRRLG